MIMKEIPELTPDHPDFWNPERCNLCGKCCTLPDSKLCRHLEIDEEKRETRCKVYETRLGRAIGSHKRRVYYCNWRKNTVVDYEGCPYNTGKPLKNPKIFKDEK